MKTHQQQIEIWEENNAIALRQFRRSLEMFREAMSRAIGILASGETSAPPDGPAVRAFAEYLLVVPVQQVRVAELHIRSHPAEARAFLQLADTGGFVSYPKCDDAILENPALEVAIPFLSVCEQVLRLLRNAEKD